jgi:hypothetical protein
MFVPILRRLVVLLFVLGILAACSTTETTLNGRVLDAYTQQPVEGARLQFGDRQAIATDEQGRYETENWSADEMVQVEAPSYEPNRLDLAAQPQLAEAQGNQPTATLDVTLRPNTLAGTVKNANTGQPVADAVVWATDTISATTNAEGSYTLTNVPENFALTVEAPDYAEVETAVSRMTLLDVTLKPNVLRGAVKDSYTDQPLEGVQVSIGDVSATTGPDGRYELREASTHAEVRFAHEGYDTVIQPAPPSMQLEATLRPNQIRGMVIDAGGQPLRDVELIATSPDAATPVSSTRTAEDGSYKLQDVPEGALITALLPGYQRAQTQVKPGHLSAELTLQPFDSKALYVTATLGAQGMAAVNEYFDIIDRTELNSMILDIKSDSRDDVGLIYYQSEAPAVVEAGTSADLMPIREILAEAKRRGIYMIARIQVFSHDNALLQVHPDWYVQRNGTPWFDHGGLAWLDAYDERVWDYNIQLAVEAAQLGFDEIQFDYIRFPSDGDLAGTVFKGPHDWANDPQPMYDNIGRFMEQAHRAINDAGAFFSADVFGYVAWEPQPSIGQNLQIMGRHADYIYPMVYPSHYYTNELGFENATAHPYEIVDHSMKLAGEQLMGEASRAKLRPWLQDFTMTWGPPSLQVTYGATEVRAQIDAAEANRDNGVNGWALWNAGSEFTIGALKPE